MLVCEPLAAVARHGFTSRQLGLRPGAAADDGWAAVAASVGCDATTIGRVRQVHGAAVRVVLDAHDRSAVPEADAIVTGAPGRAVAVVVADCVPILIADPATGAVAAVHAGWRGTAANVASAAVASLATHAGATPATLVAAIGPSIGPCCYTVGPELVTAFQRAGHARDVVERWFEPRGDGLVLDLWAANRDLLAAAGVAPANVYVAGLCTKTHREVFESFRADGDAAGRMAAIIVAPGA
jgi:YfiH family protein